MHVSINYEWRETENDVTIVVPLKGMSFKNVDIYVSDLMVKISHAPFLLLIDLIHEVIPTSLVTLHENNILLLTLEKASKCLWNEILYGGCKKDAMKRRKESMARRAQEISKLHNMAREKKIDEERSTLRDQVRLIKKYTKLQSVMSFRSILI